MIEPNYWDDGQTTIQFYRSVKIKDGEISLDSTKVMTQPY